MKRTFISIIILGLFFGSIIIPSIIFEPKELIFLGLQVNKLYFGVFHIPSLVFIFGAFSILWFSKTKDEVSVRKLQHNISTNFQEADILISQNNYEVEDLHRLFFNTKNNYLSSLENIISFGSSEKELEILIDQYMLKIYIAYEKLKSDYEYIATILPMLGMIGTIAGLLQMFGSPMGVGGEDDFATKFSGLSIALATTLYASLLTVLVVKPALQEVEKISLEMQQHEMNILIKSKLFLHRLDSQIFLEYYESKLEK